MNKKGMVAIMDALIFIGILAFISTMLLTMNQESYEPETIDASDISETIFYTDMTESNILPNMGDERYNMADVAAYYVATDDAWSDVALYNLTSSVIYDKYNFKMELTYNGETRIIENISGFDPNNRTDFRDRTPTKADTPQHDYNFDYLDKSDFPWGDNFFTPDESDIKEPEKEEEKEKVENNSDSDEKSLLEKVVDAIPLLPDSDVISKGAENIVETGKDVVEWTQDVYEDSPVQNVVQSAGEKTQEIYENSPVKNVVQGAGEYIQEKKENKEERITHKVGSWIQNGLFGKSMNCSINAINSNVTESVKGYEENVELNWNSTHTSTWNVIGGGELQVKLYISAY